MVKSKKASSSKKAKIEEIVDTEANTEMSPDKDIKIEDEDEKIVEENGEVDLNLKKKGKIKAAKKEKATSEDDTKENDEIPTQENGDGDGVEKKKPAPTKKAAKKAESKPTTEAARKSSRTPKPVTKEDEDNYEKPGVEGARKSSRAASKPAVKDEEETYEVEKLVDFRLQRGKAQFLVRWKGYSKADDTWEDEDGLNCPELLQKYKDSHPNTANRAKKRPSKSPSKTSKKSKTKKDEKDFEVEEILGMRVRNGKKEFRIRWKGYKPSDDSWEPEKHLCCQDLIEEYLENHKEEVEAEDKKVPAKVTKSAAKGKKRKT